MSTSRLIKVGLLKQSELEEAAVLSGWRSERFWDCLIHSTSWVTAI
jgi:hypothetical protein